MKRSYYKDSFKSLDMFGHVINLNFNRQGTTHKTTLGAVVSILVRAFIFYYTIENIRKML